MKLVAYKRLQGWDSTLSNNSNKGGLHSPTPKENKGSSGSDLGIMVRIFYHLFIVQVNLMGPFTWMGS
jgi:hypothetical protein